MQRIRLSDCQDKEPIDEQGQTHKSQCLPHVFRYQPVQPENNEKQGHGPEGGKESEHIINRVRSHMMEPEGPLHELFKQPDALAVLGNLRAVIREAKQWYQTYPCQKRHQVRSKRYKHRSPSP